MTAANRRVGDGNNGGSAAVGLETNALHNLPILLRTQRFEVLDDVGALKKTTGAEHKLHKLNTVMVGRQGRIRRENGVRHALDERLMEVQQLVDDKTGEESDSGTIFASSLSELIVGDTRDILEDLKSAWIKIRQLASLKHASWSVSYNLRRKMGATHHELLIGTAFKDLLNRNGAVLPQSAMPCVLTYLVGNGEVRPATCHVGHDPVDVNSDLRQ
jgi:hypothetical protein